MLLIKKHKSYPLVDKKNKSTYKGLHFSSAEISLTKSGASRVTEINLGDLMTYNLFNTTKRMDNQIDVESMAYGAINYFNIY